MSLYENQKCPVCGVAFKSGDDIVTCPECGTPHHRQCYEKIGKCANASLHSTGFVYERAQEPETENQQQANQQQINQQKNPYFIPPHGASVQGGAQQNQNGYTHIPMNFGNQQGEKAGFVFKNDDKIDGVLLSDIITVIGANFLKFISKFKKNKKMNWNWSAFIFGPYYLFFRKMNGPGTIFLTLEFAARFIISMVFSKQLTAFVNGASSLIENSSISPEEYYSKLNSLIKSSDVIPAYLILTAVLVVIHLIIGVLADWLYKRKVFSVVSDVDSKVESGTTVMPFSITMQSDAELSPAEVRKLFLASKGGVSFFSPCIAFLVLNLVTDIISYL